MTVPSSSSNSSTFTASGSSTSRRARNSRRSFTGPACAAACGRCWSAERHARASGARDPDPPGALDQVRIAPLLRGHRQDDRLDPVELALVDLDAAELLADAGDHPQQRLQRAEPADLLELIEEVVEPELLLADLALDLLGLILVELLLGLLDQGHDVAHPEDALRHAVRVEALELVELLARRRVDDGLAGDGLDAQSGAAARVAV